MRKYNIKRRTMSEARLEYYKQHPEAKLRIPKVGKGKKHPCWKGDSAGYEAKHSWLNRNHPKLNICEICGRIHEEGEHKFDYANKNHIYTRLRKDYQELCKQCHKEYDIKNNLKGVI